MAGLGSAPAPAAGAGGARRYPVLVLASLACLVTFAAGRCVYEPHAVVGGVVPVVPGTQNLQGSVDACCASCQRHGKSCNVWVWCPNPAGCIVGKATVPYQSCELKYQNGTQPSAHQPLQFAGRGDTPFTSGAVIEFADQPRVNGYVMHKARGLYQQFDYSCPTSLTGPDSSFCIHPGYVQDLATKCNDDPHCFAFSYAPNGDPNYGNRPVAWFKTQGAQTAEMDINPNMVTYLKI